MNKVINGVTSNRNYAFYSDNFCDRLEAAQQATASELQNIIDSSKATLITYYTGTTKHSVIFYNFKDEHGTQRAGYFTNGIPTHHTNNIKEAIFNVVALIWDNNDIYIKAVK